MTMRRLVFGLGGLQVLVSTIVIAAIAALAGLKGPVALVIGACLALSSTAIVLDLLSSQKRVTTSAGRASFAVLLAQDLAVIPVLMFISIFGADTGGSVLKNRRHGTAAGGSGGRADRRGRAGAVAAPVPPRRTDAVERIVHRHDPVRHRRDGRRRRGG